MVAMQSSNTKMTPGWSRKKESTSSQLLLLLFFLRQANRKGRGNFHWEGKTVVVELERIFNLPPPNTHTGKKKERDFRQIRLELW